MPLTMIIASSRHVPLGDMYDSSIVVTTPLDAIARLEKPYPVQTVVLVGPHARNRELVEFLARFYPSIQIERQIESRLER
jgi:hypothetical protein